MRGTSALRLRMFLSAVVFGQLYFMRRCTTLQPHLLRLEGMLMEK